MAQYALGLDFGTESARAVVVGLAEGREAGTAVAPYPHGVVEGSLPDGGRLEPDWALQDADDYLAVLEQIVPAALEAAGVHPADIVGIGVDFTACTLVPCRADGTPLSRDARLRTEPHAWTRLWKHHAAQPEADRVNRLATERGEPFLARYGGLTSSEWLLPKAWQLLDEAPTVYAEAGCLVEAGDWLVWQLTGRLSRSACQAGYKALWGREEGYPSPDFLRALDPRLEHLASEKLPGEVVPIGTCAGELTAATAQRLHLRPGIPVATSIIDAHAAVPAAGVSGPGTMVVILGTSGCHMVLAATGNSFPGIAGVVQDGILPGYFGYEAGQPATGDILNWFVRHSLPAAEQQEAKARGISPHQLLSERAALLRPGESGLLALDWWNGNRSVLMDAELSGVLLGLTLDTRPEHIYRALIEGTAFGTRVILENFVRHGIEIHTIVGAGGLSERHELLMQIYADVTGRPLHVARSGQACAVGAAILGAVAAGAARGGYDCLEEAVAHMGGVRDHTYRPDLAAHARYSAMYEEWVRLHDYFGRGHNSVLKKLRSWR